MLRCTRKLIDRVDQTGIRRQRGSTPSRRPTTERPFGSSRPFRMLRPPGPANRTNPGGRRAGLPADGAPTGARAPTCRVISGPGARPAAASSTPPSRRTVLLSCGTARCAVTPVKRGAGKAPSGTGGRRGAEPERHLGGTGRRGGQRYARDGPVTAANALICSAICSFTCCGASPPPTAHPSRSGPGRPHQQSPEIRSGGCSVWRHLPRRARTRALSRRARRRPSPAPARCRGLLPGAARPVVAASYGHYVRIMWRCNNGDLKRALRSAPMMLVGVDALGRLNFRSEMSTVLARFALIREQPASENGSIDVCAVSETTNPRWRHRLAR
jgi:hypothetical protein